MSYLCYSYRYKSVC